jgi:ATP-dependent Lon protease
MLHIINDRRKSGNGCARNIAIVGPPGTGKTAIGSAMAKVLGLPFEKISMGGMDDASIFKGSDRVWNSSSPSIVLQILSRIKSSSGVIMFDEIDKLGETPKGREVQYTLLHISDYIHNKEFRDNYLNKYPHDFSKLLFVFCANKIETLDSALLNRLDIIYTRSYTEEEKLSITTNYVLPRALEKLGIKANQIKFNTKALDKLVSVSTNDPGVRTIEKIIKEVVGKINMYNSVMLDDGTTGSLDLGYTIPNFKLPLIIDVKLLNDLTADMAMEV